MQPIKRIKRVGRLAFEPPAKNRGTHRIFDG